MSTSLTYFYVPYGSQESLVSLQIIFFLILRIKVFPSMPSASVWTRCAPRAYAVTIAARIKIAICMRFKQFNCKHFHLIIDHQKARMVMPKPRLLFMLLTSSFLNAHDQGPSVSLPIITFIIPVLYPQLSYNSSNMFQSSRKYLLFCILP